MKKDNSESWLLKMYKEMKSIPQQIITSKAMYLQTFKFVFQKFLTNQLFESIHALII